MHSRVFGLEGRISHLNAKDKDAGLCVKQKWWMLNAGERRRRCSDGIMSSCDLCHIALAIFIHTYCELAALALADVAP